MRVGCLSNFLYSPQTASQSIFFLSISLLSYEGSLMFQAFRYPWRMPRGSPCHVKVLSFTVALMPFLNGLCSALGGEQTTKIFKHKNYWPRTLFKVYETLSVPLGQLMPWPHNVSGLLHCKGCQKKVLFRRFLFFSFFFFLTAMVLSLAMKSCSIYKQLYLCAMKLWTYWSNGLIKEIFFLLYWRASKQREIIFKDKEINSFNMPVSPKCSVERSKWGPHIYAGSG